MNYIIDPKIVYWISVVDNIKMFITYITAASLIISVIVLVPLGIDYYEFKFKEDKAKIKILLRVIVVSILFIFISLFIPSKKTAIEMVIASKVTTENIQAAKEEIYDVIDYTIEKINSVEK